MFVPLFDMTHQLAENNRPSSVGDNSNLPRDVRAVAGLRSPVVAWSTTMNQGHRQGLHACSPTCMIACVITCFPLFSCIAILQEHRRIYWILTETELKIVELCATNHFVDEIKKSGDSLHTIPLDHVTACGVKPANWYRFFPHICVEVSETIEDDVSGYFDSTHTAVGLALAGQDWLAKEILHRRDTLQDTGGTASSTVDIRAPSTNKCSQPARFGTMDNAPDKLLQWAAQEDHCRIVAWTTLDPPKTQEICLFILLHVFTLCYVLLALSFLSSPMMIYMLVRLVNGHPILPYPVPFVTGTWLVLFLLLYAVLMKGWVNDALEDNYWVVTETDLFVLPKRHAPYPSLYFKRKIPLLSIARCIVTAKGQCRLDRRDASFPSVFVSTTSKKRWEFAIRGQALAESKWFMQHVLDQRDEVRSLQGVLEVFA
jgi:hypothetical protein